MDDKWATHYKWLLGGACLLIVALTGGLIGLWTRSLEDSIGEIRDNQRALWGTVNERANVPSRVTELEKRADDTEQRLRTIEHGKR